MQGLRRAITSTAARSSRTPILPIRGQLAAVSRTRAPATAALNLQFVRHSSASHAEETFEEFTARYTTFFQSVQDIFELQRGLNNCFAYDLVPAPSIIEAALRAARRVNDYGTAVRIFEGLKEKVENNAQYEAYLSELKDIKEELGVNTKEELYGL